MMTVLPTPSLIWKHRGKWSPTFRLYGRSAELTRTHICIACSATRRAVSCATAVRTDNVSSCGKSQSALQGIAQRLASVTQTRPRCGGEPLGPAGWAAAVGVSRTGIRNGSDRTQAADRAQRR